MTPVGIQDLPVVVVGAGFGGITAALELARRGLKVVVFESQEHVGGKARHCHVADRTIACGPTVLTMPWVFEQLFADAGACLQSLLPLRKLHTLAQHVWPDGSTFTLGENLAYNTDAIGSFAGKQAACGYADFCAHTENIYKTVLKPFILGAKPSIGNILRQLPATQLLELTRIDAFTTMHTVLKRYFTDKRLLQLFGRYATYCGGSPYQTPATLNLVAHVEQQGVFAVPQGLSALAKAMADLAATHGATFCCNTQVVRLCVQAGAVVGVELQDGQIIPSAAVILNTDAQALPQLLQPHTTTTTKTVPTALSAVLFACVAKAQGIALARHNVFFANDAQHEFDTIFKKQRLPCQGTVYIHAEDRQDEACASDDAQRLMLLINAPAGMQAFTEEDIATCFNQICQHLSQCGLKISPQTSPMTYTPADFARMSPASHGALYGPPPHSWRTFFQRPGNRHSLNRLYLCGGSVHPGPGVPMAALSGKMAAQTWYTDLTSTKKFRQTVMPGGTLMPKATTANMP